MMLVQTDSIFFNDTSRRLAIRRAGRVVGFRRDAAKIGHSDCLAERVVVFGCFFPKKASKGERVKKTDAKTLHLRADTYSILITEDILKVACQIKSRMPAMRALHTGPDIVQKTTNIIFLVFKTLST